MDSDKQPVAVEAAKRDADVYDLLAWLEVNRVKVAIAAVVLVAIGFILATARYMARQKELQASAQLLALKPTLTPNTNATPAQASAYVKVADEFSGTRAGERARIFAGNAFFTEGRYAEAEKEFKRFVQDFPNSPWTADAAYGVAASQESLNRGEEAFASYQNVVTAHANSVAAHEAKLAMARIYETRKQPEQALRLYNELTAPLPGAQPGQAASPEAQARKDALLRANPTLNTNRVAPAAAFSMPAPAVSSNAPAAVNTNAAKVVDTNAAAAPAASNAAKP